jgi:hypothetical protein
MAHFMKNKGFMLVLILAICTTIFGGCGEKSTSSNLSKDVLSKKEFPKEDTLDDLRLRNKGLTYAFELVGHEEDIEVVITFDFEGTDAEYAELKKKLSLLKVRQMEDRFIYDQPNNPTSRRPTLVAKRDQKAHEDKDSQEEPDQKVAIEEPEPAEERVLYHFTGDAKWGQGDLETVALQKMWNKNKKTALSGDKNGHGASGKEICTWGKLSQSSFVTDQNTNKSEIKQVTGFEPNIGVYDHIMVDYYNWRMENKPEYRVYADEIADSCSEQKKIATSGQ